MNVEEVFAEAAKHTHIKQVEERVLIELVNQFIGCTSRRLCSQIQRAR